MSEMSSKRKKSISAAGEFSSAHSRGMKRDLFLAHFFFCLICFIHAKSTAKNNILFYF